MPISQFEILNYQAVVKQALAVLDKENLSLIIHGVSFPSNPSEDTGTGTINSDGAKRLINFIEKIGFNSIQLGPDGKTKLGDLSPYISTIFSTNTLFINLAELTTPEWAEILSKKTFENIVENNPNKDKAKLAYSYIYNKQDEALQEAFNTFKVKLNDKKSKESKTINSISKKFDKFKKENNSWLHKDSLYEALSKKHNNDYWSLWNDKLDKNLFDAEHKGTKVAKDRIEEIENTYAKEIEFYKFCQFLANEQKIKTRKFALDHNIKTMADIQVAFSDRDYWSNKSLFLHGYYLGCPPDYFSEDGQTWGFPVLDPEKIFNKDGSLDEGGKFLKERFNKVFKENPGGARIDHAVGLIDPWVYRAGKTAKPEDGGRRLYSSPDMEVFAKYSRIEVKDLNTYRSLKNSAVEPEKLDNILPPENEQRVNRASLENPEVFKKYAEIVDIILQAAKDNGIDKKYIIFEDLGTITNPVAAVMEKLGLCGIRVTQFVTPDEPEHMYRGKNVAERHWITTGTHDNMPLLSCIADLYKDHNLLEKHISYLTEDLIHENNSTQKEAFSQKLRNDFKELVKAKLAELFASSSKNIQLFFTDVFGIEEAYNKPGTSGDENWSLRLSNNFEELYFNKLHQNLGLNLPEVLKLAIESKGNDFIGKVLEQNPELLKNLEICAEKLKSNINN